MNQSAYELTGRMMTEQTRRLEAITDNLANSATPGYRRTQVSTPSFDQVLQGTADPSRRSMDLTNGGFRNTGVPTDFAITGSGFFVLEKDGREFLTRNGQFAVAGDGRLTTPSGFAVLGEDGPINLPPDVDMSRMNVDGDGTVRADGQALGRLRITEPADAGLLERVGPSLLRLPAGAATRTPPEFSVTNRSLEGSNTSVFQEMADMMSSFRSFQMCHKLLQTQDASQSSMIKTYSA